MKAVVWHGVGDIRLDDVEYPKVQEPTDAIVRITSTAICGSDLHLYEVMKPFMEEGDVLGHEPMGIVEEVGKEVTDIAPGDRVVIPFQIACGHCFMCDQGLHTQCETTQVRDQGNGAALFGYTKLYARCPEASGVPARPTGAVRPIKVPRARPTIASCTCRSAADACTADGVRRIPTGAAWSCSSRSDRGHVAVSPASGAARHRIDPVPERLERARQMGVGDARPGRLRRDIAGVRSSLRTPRPGLGDRRGRMEAHGRPSQARPGWRDAPYAVAQKLWRRRRRPPSPLRLAIELVRRCGTISLSGVYGGQADPLPMLTLFDKQIQLRMGQANVKRWVDDIMPLIAGDDDPLGVEDFATHRLPLEEGPRAYEQFQKKQDGMVKVLLQPGLAAA